MLSQGTSMSPFWLKTPLQQFFPARLPPVLPLGSQSRSCTGGNCCCKAMAGQIQPTFQAPLTECNVPEAFQEWLVANIMVDSAKFLLGARKTSTLNLSASLLTASHWHKRVRSAWRTLCASNPPMTKKRFGLRRSCLQIPRAILFVIIWSILGQLVVSNRGAYM